MAPTQEDILARSSSVVGASNVPILNSRECTTDLPSASGTGALLDTIIAPPSNSTTELVSTCKIPLLSLSLLFIQAHRV